MRTPKSLLAGLMWFDPQKGENTRHNAQERDGESPFIRLSHPICMFVPVHIPCTAKSVMSVTILLCIA